MNYTANEYCDMLIIYGECNQNSLLAAEEYARRFPERRSPNHNVFLRLINRVRNTGNVIPVRKGIGREQYVRNNEIDAMVLSAIDEDPRTSIRTISRRLQISNMTVQRILKENRLHAYHFTRVQNLLPMDYARRLNFCTWLLEQAEGQPGFLQTILFTDESYFTREGSFNTHNAHVWSNLNPNAYTIKSYQYRFNINLWAGLLHNSIIGPFQMPAALNGAAYNDFLNNDLPNLLENVPLNVRQRMMYQQDGAPPHNSIVARRTLDDKFPGRWIGRNGPINWPARSPDLTPLDFFLWGHVKEYIYTEEIENRMELEDKIIEAFAAVTPQMIFNATTSLLRRARLCIECGGGHFEHLL